MNFQRQKRFFTRDFFSVLFSFYVSTFLILYVFYFVLIQLLVAMHNKRIKYLMFYSFIHSFSR